MLSKINGYLLYDDKDNTELFNKYKAFTMGQSTNRKANPNLSKESINNFNENMRQHYLQQ